MSIPKAPDDLVRPIRKEIPALARDAFRLLARDEAFPGVYPPIPDPRAAERRNPGEPYSNFMLYRFDPDRFAYFAVGDIHGDLASFVRCADAAAETVRRSARPDRNACLIVLGDLIDRGPASLECVAFLLRLALGCDHARKNIRILFVKGDHDVSLRTSDADIASGVSNGAGSDGDRLADELAEPDAWFTPAGALTRAFRKFLDGCPAAAWFDNGMLFAHGAVPHIDLQQRFGADTSLWSPACAKDFMWCRLHERAPRKIPNRGSSTCEIGYKDFGSFVERLDGISARCLPGGSALRLYCHGHEHVAGGYKLFTHYPIPVHTLTSFSDPDAFPSPAVCRILSIETNEKTEPAIAVIEPETLAGIKPPSTENPVAPETPETTPPLSVEPQKIDATPARPEARKARRLSASVFLFCKRLFARLSAERDNSDTERKSKS